MPPEELLGACGCVGQAVYASEHSRGRFINVVNYLHFGSAIPNHVKYELTPLITGIFQQQALVLRVLCCCSERHSY